MRLRVALNARIHERCEESWGNQELSPLSVISRCWLGGYRLVEGFALFLEGRYIGPNCGQHISEFDYVSSLCHRPMSGNDYRLIRDHAQVPFGSTDHSIDVSTRGVINKRIDAIPQCVSDVNHVPFFEDHGDIAVGVGGAVILEGNIRVIVMHTVLITKDRRGNCSGWCRRKGVLPSFNTSRGGEMLLCVLVSCNYRPC